MFEGLFIYLGIVGFRGLGFNGLGVRGFRVPLKRSIRGSIKGFRV